MNTVCPECNGDSAENLVGNPIQCEACQDTGRLHDECIECGTRHDVEEHCPGCERRCEEERERAEAAYDSWVDSKIDERRER